MKMASLYETVTQRIINELEAGAPPWIKPWKDGKRTGIMPQNAATGRPYSGVNILLLWAAREANGWPTPGFMTFQQALDMKACVRKGEKGTPVIFAKRLTVKDDDEDKQVQMARTYYVFNEAQIEGLPHPKADEVPKPIPQKTELSLRCEQFIRAPAVPIRYGGNKACYVPSQDFIALPEESAFKTIEHHHATALHELIHALGHEKRLNRDLKNRFGTEAYAAEELIAELGAAFLCAHLGIEGELRHAGYIEHWLKLLRKDDRAIFTAASQASKAADYLRAFTELVQEEAA